MVCMSNQYYLVMIILRHKWIYTYMITFLTDSVSFIFVNNLLAFS